MPRFTGAAYVKRSQGGVPRVSGRGGKRRRKEKVRENGKWGDDGKEWGRKQGDNGMKLC